MPEIRSKSFFCYLVCSSNTDELIFVNYWDSKVQFRRSQFIKQIPKEQKCTLYILLPQGFIPKHN